MAKQPTIWGVYYMISSNAEEWLLAFPVEVLTDEDFERAKMAGSLVKKELKCYAVRLIKNESSPKLAREKVRQLGRAPALTVDQETEMQARFMAQTLTGNLEWTRMIEGALHAWRRMPMVEKLKFAPSKKEEKESHDV